MGRRKIDPTEKVIRLLNEAAIEANSLEFSRLVCNQITDEIWGMSRKIECLERERIAEEIRRNKEPIVNFAEPPVAEIICTTKDTVVIKCPYCGQRHIHGRVSGHVVAHCLERLPGNIGYIISDKDNSEKEGGEVNADIRTNKAGGS